MLLLLSLGTAANALGMVKQLLDCGAMRLKDMEVFHS